MKFFIKDEAYFNTPVKKFCFVHNYDIDKEIENKHSQIIYDFVNSFIGGSYYWTDEGYLKLPDDSNWAFNSKYNSQFKNMQVFSKLLEARLEEEIYNKNKLQIKENMKKKFGKPFRKIDFPSSDILIKNSQKTMILDMTIEAIFYSFSLITDDNYIVDCKEYFQNCGLSYQPNLSEIYI